MREIKFRGRKANGQWIYGHLFVSYSKAYILPNTTFANLFSYHQDYEVAPETMGQFTGLFDKNGNEIYEGDILRTKIIDKVEPSGFVYVYNEVGFKDGSFVWVGEVSGESFPFDDSEIEEDVVGNIHDNPELLKAGIN